MREIIYKVYEKAINQKAYSLDDKDNEEVKFYTILYLYIKGEYKEIKHHFKNYIK